MLRSRKQCFKWSPGTGNSFSSWPAQNATWGKSRKRCFKSVHVYLNSFTSSYPSQNATLLKWRKRCLKGPHVPCGPFKQHIFGLWNSQKWDWWIQKFDSSSGSKALRAHFLPLEQPKMSFVWSWKSDDSSCRMALWNHLLFLDQPKMRLLSIC